MSTNRFKLFGTWKNRLTYAESVRLAQDVNRHVASLPLPFELSFCPPMIALKGVAELIPTHIALTAQNLIWDDAVSFTGETSAEALKRLGCKYVIIGHSERRIYLGEDDEIVARKVSTAVTHKLIPIVCVGEFYDDYKQGRSDQVVQQQMKAVLASLRTYPEPYNFVIAYEPAWAISTSRESLKCKPTEANSRHRQIRELIRAELGNDFADNGSVVYGGSITAQNAPEYFSQSDIDGGLVGTASQTKEGFIKLIESSCEVFGKKGAPAQI